MPSAIASPMFQPSPLSMPETPVAGTLVRDAGLDVGEAIQQSGLSVQSSSSFLAWVSRNNVAAQSLKFLPSFQDVSMALTSQLFNTWHDSASACNSESSDELGLLEFCPTTSSPRSTNTWIPSGCHLCSGRPSTLTGAFGIRFDRGLISV